VMVWDSMFFGRIAHAGYEYEQFYAFLPLYPALVWAVSSCGASSCGLIWRSSACAVHAIGLMSRCFAGKGIVPGSSIEGMTAVGAIAVSNAAFVVSAVYLDKCVVMCCARSYWL